MGRVFSALLVMFALGSAELRADWQLKRFDGRDYVRIGEVAEFYGLSKGATQERTLEMSAGKRSLRLTRDSRLVEINGVNYWLSFAILQRDGEFWVSRMDLGKTIEPVFRPELVQGLRGFTTVILDPGHGGRDRGAVGPYEVEKNFALDVARRVRDELQKAGLRVLMTRNNDSFVELYDRADLANSKVNSIFVSLHFNASPNLGATGLEIFSVSPRGSPSTEYDEVLVRDMVQEYGNENEVQSFALAHAIYHAMRGAPLEMPDRGVKRARFAVLRLTKMPAVLVEGGFLTNRNDARLVANTAWRDKYARAIATGILEFKKLTDLRMPPRIAADYSTEKPGSSLAAVPNPTPESPTSTTLLELPPAKTN